MTPLDNLKGYCDSIGLTPRTLIEVGAAHPATYRLGDFVLDGHKVVLIEANPRLHYCLTRGFDFGDFQKEWPAIPEWPHQYAGLEAFPNVTVVNAAIVDVATAQVAVHECNASSYVGGVKSPATVNDGYKEDGLSYAVRGATIDEFDDGDVDVLLADCEGSELFCIKHLRSSPKLIILETHGQRYVNPNISEIVEWMKQRNYTVVAQNQTDTAFLRGV